MQSDDFDREAIKNRIEASNPWRESVWSDDTFEFNSLADSDRKIMGQLLQENIEDLNKEEAKDIVQSRFEDFEEAFNGNFVNPRVIVLGINPKMSELHDPYGLKDTVYKEPFNNKRPILCNNYYRGSQGMFFAGLKNHDNLKNDLEKMIYKDDVTPVALWEFFPYASENEREWQKGYKISTSLKRYFQLKQILPSQIWMLCLLTYTIKTADSKLILFLRKNNKNFRESFLYEYFKLLGLEQNEQIEILSKKAPSSKYLSKGNIKSFYESKLLKIRTDTIEHFFKDVWGIS